MVIRLAVKSLSRRSRALDDREFTIPDDVSSLRALLLELARQLWMSYGRQPVDAEWLAALSQEAIAAGVENGKVGFGRKHGGRQATWESVSKRVVQAFEDGQYRVFQNGEERTSLDSALPIAPQDRFLLVRLVMLSGSLLPF